MSHHDEPEPGWSGAVGGLGVTCPRCGLTHLGSCDGGFRSRYPDPQLRIEPAPTADALQRREYAKAALTGIAAHVIGPTEKPGESGPQAHARWAFDVADAMLVEQKKRETK